jgi:chromatin segregation and condensation protein Rec8/ScpA/Scc1 (kleisin family)
VAGMTEKLRIIVTFIVILELIKNRVITIIGGEDFNNFVIKKL